MAKRQRNYVLKIVGRYGPEPLVIRPPFSIEFNISRFPYSLSSMGTIRVYNLNEADRNSIMKIELDTNAYNRCELSAGYGEDLHPIIIGGTRRCWSMREGTNYITNIEVSTDQYQYINSKVSLTLQKGATKLSVIDQLTKVLPEIGRPIVGREFDGQIYSSRGVALEGSALEILKNQVTNGNFFIDNEVPYLLAENECITGIFNKINSSSGLIGSPRLEGEKIVFNMIFEPRILMFQSLILESQTETRFNGKFKVIGLRHSGMISDAVCGQATTEVQLLRTDKLLTELTGFTYGT